MTLKQCPYCVSCVKSLPKHLERAHPLLDVSDTDGNIKGTNIANDDLPCLNTKTKKKKRKKKKDKSFSVQSLAQDKSLKKSKPYIKPIGLVMEQRKKAKLRRLAKKGIYRPCNSSMRTQPMESEIYLSRGKPILSKSGRYPIGNCYRCRDEVFRVPVEYKNGNVGIRYFNISSMQPHNCNQVYLDVLDHPATVTRFQPKQEKYTRKQIY